MTAKDFEHSKYAAEGRRLANKELKDGEYILPLDMAAALFDGAEMVEGWDNERHWVEIEGVRVFDERKPPKPYGRVPYS